MLMSKRLNELSKRIHDLAKKEDVSEWNYSSELHLLIAQRKNLVNEMLNQGVKISSVTKTILDFHTPQIDDFGDLR